MAGSGGAGAFAGAGTGGERPGCVTEEAYCNDACIAAGRTANGCTGFIFIDAGIGIALDSTHVYAMNSAEILRAPKAGGAVETVVAVSSIPSAFTVNATLVLWIEDAKIRAIPKTGGAPFDLFADESVAGGVVASDSRVFFWRNAGGGGEVVSVDLSGSNLMVHASDDAPQPSLIALDSTHFYWVHSNLFDPGELRRVPQSGTTVETVATAQNLWNFAIGGSSVFYRAEGQLWRVPVAGGQPVLVHTMTDAGGMYFAMGANEGGVYWTGETTVRWASVDGTNLASAAVSNYTKFLQADSSGVYVDIDMSSAGPGVVTRIDL